MAISQADRGRSETAPGTRYHCRGATTSLSGFGFSYPAHQAAHQAQVLGASILVPIYVRRRKGILKILPRPLQPSYARRGAYICFLRSKNRRQARLQRRGRLSTHLRTNFRESSTGLSGAPAKGDIQYDASTRTPAGLACM